MGVKMSCMARSILPPGATMVFGRDMNESCSMVSRYGKSMPRGLAKRITRKLSSGRRDVARDERVRGVDDRDALEVDVRLRRTAGMM